MPLQEMVCRACQQGHGGFTASDVDRWENHGLILCPAVFIAGDPQTEDKRTLRSTKEDPAVWCPSKDKHKKQPRKNYVG